MEWLYLRKSKFCKSLTNFAASLRKCIFAPAERTLAPEGILARAKSDGNQRAAHHGIGTAPRLTSKNKHGFEPRRPAVKFTIVPILCLRNRCSVNLRYRTAAKQMQKYTLTMLIHYVYISNIVNLQWSIVKLYNDAIFFFSSFPLQKITLSLPSSQCIFSVYQCKLSVNFT